jgi:hypothetical protein
LVAGAAEKAEDGHDAIVPAGPQWRNRAVSG